MKFKESELAHKYCKGKGIELGAASHNPFNLAKCKNVAPICDQTFYEQAQRDMGEEPVKIDYHGTADNIPVSDESKDYIVSSHVVEHIPDLIGAFLEWNRVLKNEGIIFTIFPKRNALPSDVGRPLSTIEEIEKNHIPGNKGKVDEHNHIWVFSLHSFIDLIVHCNHEYKLGWKILEVLETDDKAGNGHCVICQKHVEY